jgi:hypothetical protein
VTTSRRPTRATIDGRAYLICRTWPADSSVLQRRPHFPDRDARQREAQPAHRRAPLADALDGYATLGQARWAAWRRKQHLDDRLPSSFAKVLNEVIAFADLALQTDVGKHEWDPHTRGWH